MTADEFLAQEGYVPYVIPGLREPGARTLLCGPAASGKTPMACELAAALVTGTEFYGLPRLGGPRVVLLISADPELPGKLETVRQERAGYSFAALHIGRSFPTTPEALASLGRIVEDVSPQFVILDDADGVLEAKRVDLPLVSLMLAPRRTGLLLTARRAGPELLEWASARIRLVSRGAGSHVPWELQVGDVPLLRYRFFEQRVHFWPLDEMGAAEREVYACLRRRALSLRKLCFHLGRGEYDTLVALRGLYDRGYVHCFNFPQSQRSKRVILGAAKYWYAVALPFMPPAGPGGAALELAHNTTGERAPWRTLFSEAEVAIVDKLERYRGRNAGTTRRRG